MKPTAAVFLSLILTLCTACDPSAKSWQEAQDAGTIASYQAFVTQHPESKYASEAHLAIDDLAYKKAIDSQTEAGVAAYIGDFPSGGHLDEMQALLKKMRLDRFVGGINDHLLGFINETETDIVALQGKPWGELNLARGMKSGGFDIYKGRTIFRENSVVVFEDTDKKFQFVGTTIDEAQYAAFAKIAELNETSFESGVTLTLSSGEMLQYDGAGWVHTAEPASQ
jgi:hypothetical protein